MRVLILGLVLVVSACGQAPTTMRASQASLVLEQFAAGGAPADLCTAEGRAMLRGAVRAYSAAMADAGEAWPAASQGDDGLGNVEAMVLVAAASGFVEPADFRDQASILVERIVFAHWPELRGMRDGARVACNEMVDLQISAARFVLESDRYERLFQLGPASADARTTYRAERQALRVERARTLMNTQAVAVEQRIEASAAAR